MGVYPRMKAKKPGRKHLFFRTLVYILIMATTRHEAAGLKVRHHQRGNDGSTARKWHGRERSEQKPAGRNRSGWSRPQPTHFLSVRIDNPLIWEKVAAVQHSILGDRGDLEGAVIPVQDLHLTLFMVTLHEDGNLERARVVLEGCHDILQDHGLLANAASLASGEDKQHLAESSVSMSATGAATSDVEDDARIDDVVETHPAEAVRAASSLPLVMSLPTTAASTPPTKATKVTAAATETPPPQTGLPLPPPRPTAITSTSEAKPLLLTFQGLGNFRDKVLFARLVEDDQACRFRSLAAALHRRFSQARLLTPSAPTDGMGEKAGTAENKFRGNATGEENSEFVFKPHLTVMKTSKLKNWKTKIQSSSYAKYADCDFGSHAPTAVELSSRQEKEESVNMPQGFEPRPYYRCEHRIALPPSK